MPGDTGVVKKEQGQGKSRNDGEQHDGTFQPGQSLKREAAGIVIVASREEELLTRPKIYQDILS